MRERPIIFNGPMVRAILDGRKTQTRRVLPHGKYRLELVAPADGGPSRCPFGRPGDRLWVREAWAAPHAYDHLPPRLIPRDARIHYAATEGLGGLRSRPSIHMPRWASRITLEITGVRVERLQEISEADARAEGALPLCHFNAYDDSQLNGFVSIWRAIHGARSWDANPWVWVVEFRRIEQ